MAGIWSNTLLDRGHTVRCLVRKSSQTTHLRNHGAQLFVGDMREPDSLKQAVDGVGVVFHLAGVTSASLDFGIDSRKP